MELRQLRYFVAVAEELNFTRAALRLHIAQPSLSLQIQQLENEIGVALVERSRRHVALTEAGKAFLDEVRLTLAQAERSLRIARDSRNHEHVLSIGFVPAAEVWCFPFILPALRMRFPEMTIKLISLPNPQLEEALCRQQIDVAFMRGPVDARDLQSRLVLTEPFVAVLPRTSPLAQRECVPVSAVNGENFIDVDPEYAGNHFRYRISEWSVHHGITLRPVQIANNVLLAMNLVGMGLGYSILPAYVEHLAGPAIRCRPFAEAPPAIDLLVAWRADRASASLSTLLELVANVPADISTGINIRTTPLNPEVYKD